MFEYISKRNSVPNSQKNAVREYHLIRSTADRPAERDVEHLLSCPVRPDQATVSGGRSVLIWWRFHRARSGTALLHVCCRIRVSTDPQWLRSDATRNPGDRAGWRQTAPQATDTPSSVRLVKTNVIWSCHLEMVGTVVDRHLVNEKDELKKRV